MNVSPHDPQIAEELAALFANADGAFVGPDQTGLEELKGRLTAVVKHES